MKIMGGTYVVKSGPSVRTSQTESDPFSANRLQINREMNTLRAMLNEAKLTIGSLSLDGTSPYYIRTSWGLLRGWTLICHDFATGGLRAIRFMRSVSDFSSRKDSLP